MTASTGKYFVSFKEPCILVFFLACFVSVLLIHCRSQKSPIGKSTDRTSRKMLLRDEGLSQLSYVDLANPKSGWHIKVPAGRDIQLVGNGRVLIGTGTGYEEHDITTGSKVKELNSFAGTIAARRLRNGNTLLTGLNWQGKEGIVLLEVDTNSKVQRTIVYPGFNYVRLVRELATGTFLVTADDTIFEGTARGSIIWRTRVAGREKPHAWQALRLANGQTVVSTGYAANLQFFATDGHLVDTIGGPAAIKPHFFAGFQILTNGNYVVTNWQGHGMNFGTVGVQLLEYSPDGRLLWSWQQDPANFSSLQAVIILDGLNPDFLHVEDANGRLSPVK